jgi:hypothetical protein
MMSIETILQALEHYTGYFPHAPLRAAIDQQEEITPHLLALVERGTRDIDRIAADPAYMGHIYAFYLLAQFREQRAYPLMVDFFSSPGEATMDATGDFVTESLGQVLASVSGGDVGPMLALAKDTSANEYVRAGALDGMLTLFVEGVKRRDEVIAELRGLFEGGLEREYSFVWDNLVVAATRLYPAELMEEIRWAFVNDLVDEGHIDLAFVKESVAEGKEATLARLRTDRHFQFIDDTIARMAWWACFDEMPEDVGRNDRCPCGSGLKYKYCCGHPALRQ